MEHTQQLQVKLFPNEMHWYCDSISFKFIEYTYSSYDFQLA